MYMNCSSVSIYSEIMYKDEDINACAHLWNACAHLVSACAHLVNACAHLGGGKIANIW